MKITEVMSGLWSNQKRMCLALAVGLIILITAFVVFLVTPSVGGDASSGSSVPVDSPGGAISSVAPDSSDEGVVDVKNRQYDFDRQISIYIENMKRAEAASTEFLGERYLGEKHVMEFLIDCDELRARRANIKVPQFRSEEEENEIKDMFDKGGGKYVFLEVGAITDSDFVKYKFVSFILDSRDDLVHIEGTNRHFARTPLHEWFSATSETEWRYDLLVNSFRSE